MRIKWINTSCCVLFSFIFATTAASGMERSDADSSHVRMWTGWYNTDKPTTGGGDDESVASIRKRGYEICDGNSPIDCICRDVTEPVIMFNSDTVDFTKDKLFIPCNNLGLLCRNADQRNTTCRDYEIRFECLSSDVTPSKENLGVIGVAAGLSVIVPILCVGIMHVVRLMRVYRAHGRQSLVGNSEQSVQTDPADLPPSYSILFGDNRGDTESMSSTSNPVRVSVTGSSGDLRLPSSTLFPNVTDNQTNLNTSIINTSSNEELGVSQNTQSSNQERTSWRSRFPNMHLSVFDLFYPSGQRSEPQSPQSSDLSYVQTPPPTYKDAIIILGREPTLDTGDKI